VQITEQMSESLCTLAKFNAMHNKMDKRSTCVTTILREVNELKILTFRRAGFLVCYSRFAGIELNLAYALFMIWP
jgi:hypothetical protein